MAFWKSSEPPKSPEKSQASPVTATSGNGKPRELSAEALEKRASASKALKSAFGEIVTLLMRSPQFKNYTLADLEWAVAPALLSGQFSLATVQSKTNGLTSPAGVVLWASVSAEVDRRLNAAAGQAIRLTPEEWRSGDNLWVMVAVGNGRVLQDMLKRLQKKEWRNKPAKVLARAKDGKPTIMTLENKAA